VKSSTIYSLLLCSFYVSANPSSLQEPIQEIEVITVEGQQLYLKKREIEHAKGFSNADIFSTFASIDANNLRNEARALDIGIRGVQGEGRVPIFIDGSLQSTHTNRGYMGTSERTYIDSDLLSTVHISKGPSVSAAPFSAGAIGGSVTMTTLTFADIVSGSKQYGGLIKLKTYNNNKMPNVSDDARQQSYYQISNDSDVTDFNHGSMLVASAFTGSQLSAVLAYSDKKTGNYFAGSHGYHEFVEHNDWGDILPPVNRGGEVVNTSFESQSALAKLSYQLSDEHLFELNTRHHQQKAGEMLASYWYKQQADDIWQLPDGSWEAMPEGVEAMPQWQPGTAQVNTVSASYRFLPTNNALLDIRLNAWSTHAKLEQYNALGSNFGPNALQYFHKYTNKRHGIGAYNTASLMLANTLPTTLTYGLSWQSERLQPEKDAANYFYGDQPTSRNGKQVKRSAFIDAEFDLAPFELALNFNHHDSETEDYQGHYRLEFNGKTDAIAQLTYSFSNNAYVLAKYSSAYRMPNVYETTVSNEVFSYSPYYPLSPEQTKSFELALGQQLSDLLTPKDTLAWSATYFHTRIDDMLGTAQLANPDPQAQGWQKSAFTFTNYDSFTLPGIELTVNYRGAQFYGSIAYTQYTGAQICATDAAAFNDAQRCSAQGFSGSLTPLRIPPKRKLVATLGKTFFADTLDAGLIYKGHSQKYHPGGFLVGTGVDALQRIPASYQLDMYLDYKISDALSSSLSITNVTDRYVVSSGSIVAIPEPGRTVTVSLEVKL
tara:strand:+ start:31252 stop:33567 length:2316 start_codon:yes stop_codon:yes gene_type:complete